MSKVRVAMQQFHDYKLISQLDLLLQNRIVLRLYYRWLCVKYTEALVSVQAGGLKDLEQLCEEGLRATDG